MAMAVPKLWTKIDWKMIAVFVIAYAVSLAYLAWTSPRVVIQAANEPPSSEEVKTLYMARSSPIETSAIAGPSQSAVSAIVQPAEDASHGAAASGATMEVATPLELGPPAVEPLRLRDDSGAPLPEIARQTRALGDQALQGSTPELREKAVLKLRAMPNTKESVHALAEVLHSDTSARNRLLALNALRTLASQGDDGVIREAFGHALHDRDPKIASAAHDAYEHVAGLDTPN